MDNRPEVSIITPAYNCETVFKDTFNSVISQTFTSWEWIIIEDHSTDSTLEMLRKTCKNCSNIHILRTEVNGGAAFARNLGISFAKGRFIAFLDADDLWKNNKLEKQVAFMKENKFAFTYSDYDLLFSDNSTRNYKSKHDFESYNSLLKANNIGCLTVIYDSELIGKYLMPLDCEKREDHGLWLDITKKGIIAHKLPESLATYRVGLDTVSSKKIKMVHYQYLLYRRHEKFGVLKSVWYLMICSFSKLFRKY